MYGLDSVGHTMLAQQITSTPKGNRNALTHGQTNAEAKAFRIEVRQTMAEAKTAYLQCMVVTKDRDDDNRTY